MKTHTTILLLILFAITSLGCGRGGGGASDVPATADSAKQSPPDIRLAEAGAGQSQTTGVVADGTYEVCDVEKTEEEWGREDRPTGPHITLDLNDEIVVKQGQKNDLVSSVVFRHFAKPEKDRTEAEGTEAAERDLAHDDQVLRGRNARGDDGIRAQKKGDKEPKDDASRHHHLECSS